MLVLNDIHQIIGKWQKRLGLLNWEIDIKIDDGTMDHADSYCEIHRHDTAHKAYIYIRKWLISLEDIPGWVLDDINDVFIERIVVHEICHILFRDLNALAKEYLSMSLNSSAYDVAEHALQLSEEKTVDDLAKALVTSWPK